MQFNALVWSSYLESSKGQAWIKFFSNLKQSHDRKDDELKKLIMHWGAHTNFADNRIDVNEEIQLVSNAIKDLLRAVDQGHIPDKVLNHIESINYFNKVSELKSEDESEELFYVDDISRLSVALYCLHPKYFFPYYFYPNFYALEKIFNEFGIFLPPVPSKSDYDSRFFYYLELCKSLSDYWEKLGFLTEHLPVFLYGFAGEVIDLKTTSEVSLPKPRRAWFVGGGTTNGDSNYLDNAKDKSMTFWTCNKDTEVGDIIVMYVLAPRSEIHSIWRAVRPAVIEPFRSYYSTVWMGHCQRLKFPLKISDLKNDSVMSQMPLVKATMQGINGRQIQKSYYDRLLLMLEQKGNKINQLPKLEDLVITDSRIQNEKDVEIYLLEPLLQRLGFEFSDWERQPKLQVGRSEKAIPDYLINVRKDKASKLVSADWVWEAKHSIKNNDQLQKDLGQVISYANLVNAKGISLISVEGLWVIIKGDNGFSVKLVQHWSAKQMLESDNLSQISSILGKKCFTKN